jgi:hypothetical protein
VSHRIEELQIAEDELAEQLQQHSEALQGVREALQADRDDVELVQVSFASGTFGFLAAGDQTPQPRVHWAAEGRSHK